MKKFILGFITALVLVGLIYWAYPFVSGFWGGRGPVPAEELKPGATDFGALKVTVLGKGSPIADVEVDLGTIQTGKGPTGPMAVATTNEQGVAMFEKVPVGVYDIFWNGSTVPRPHFPQAYKQPFSRLSVEILKGQVTEKKIELEPK